jgi:hypothetical protein
LPVPVESRSTTQTDWRVGRVTDDSRQRQHRRMWLTVLSRCCRDVRWKVLREEESI